MSKLFETSRSKLGPVFAVICAKVTAGGAPIKRTCRGKGERGTAGTGSHAHGNNHEALVMRL